MADPPDPSSHLFLVRVWQEQDHPGAEIRGRVQHVLSGEIRHFRTWRALAGFMTQFVSAADNAGEVGRQDSQGRHDEDSTLS
jgi:hypothetical protein